MVLIDPMANFLNLVFVITLPKNDRQDLQLAWAVSMRLDASYNLCSKLRSKLIF
jgi:hypothetical protein